MTYDEIFTYDNLLSSASKCKNNVTWKASVQNFLLELPYNIYKIYNDLNKRKFKIRTAYRFNIFERGKIRNICAIHIKERIVQRCLCDYYLLPLLSKTFIYDNCASLKGKGTDFAIKRLKKHLNSFYYKYGLDGYILLFDFKDFFASVPHKIIMDMFSKYIDDIEILQLINLFIEMEPNGKGLSLGNEISQVAACLIGNPIDHYIKDKCGIKYYIRYMDDGLIIHNDKEYLVKILEDINIIANELGLKINQKKTKIIKLNHGFTFLKKKINISENGKIYMRICPRSIVTMRRKLKKLSKKLYCGEMSYYDIEASYQSWRSYALKYDSYNSIKSMDRLFFNLFGDYITERKFWTYPIKRGDVIW